jgi:uncharacterized protein
MFLAAAQSIFAFLKKTNLIAFLVLWSFHFALAAAPETEKIKIPDLVSPVMDTAGILDQDTAANIERALRFLNQSSGTQITFLSVPTLGNQSIEELGIRAADQWKLGIKGKAGSSDPKLDRGLILLVAVQEHRIRIEVGRALEGSLTDLQSKRIINEKMAPLFKAGRPSDAVLVGIYEISRATDPDVDLAPYLQGTRETARAPHQHGFPIGQIIFIVLIIIISIARIGGGRGGGIGFWGGGFGGGGFGGGSGGGGWSGGGGGFNGGGASGDW